MSEAKKSKCRHRVALFHKDGLIGAFFFVVNEEQNALIKFDPRLKPPYCFFGYETPDAAEKEFYEHIARTRENGWTVVFNGKPNNIRQS